MSRIGRALRTSGRTSKLCGSGGESANHSSESPPQGSWPASGPLLRLMIALTRVTMIPMASRKVPIVAIRL
jgi:hypothetical protein